MVLCSVRASTVQPPPSERCFSKGQEGVCYCLAALACWGDANRHLRMQCRPANGNVGMAATEGARPLSNLLMSGAGGCCLSGAGQGVASNLHAFHCCVCLTGC